MVQDEPVAELPRHSVSVSAAIPNDAGQVLVIQRRDNGHWEPPGGVLELAEGIHQGLIREVQEETGLLIEPVRLTGAYKNMSRGILALVFLCRAVGGTPSTGEEVADIRWLTPAQVAKDLTPAYAARLLDAMNGATPAVRAHDGTDLIQDP
jgi:8-oxo-dGTP diphosphatase